MKIGIAIAPLLQVKKVFPQTQELLEMLFSAESKINHFELHTDLNLIQINK